MKVAKLILIAILMLTLLTGVAYSLLTYTMTIQGHGKCSSIPLIIEAYEDEECIIKLSRSSLMFPEFTTETGVEQTIDFYIKNNLDKDVSIYWRLNPNTPNLDIQDVWSDVGNGYFFAWPSRDNGWKLMLYWNYPNEYMQTSKAYGTKILKANEIQKLTLYLNCPYDYRGECSFIIDIIATEV